MEVVIVGAEISQQLPTDFILTRILRLGFGLNTLLVLQSRTETASYFETRKMPYARRPPRNVTLKRCAGGQ